jgi:hypothetical protein
MAWTPANKLRMTDGNTIAVEVDVTGTQKAAWFQDSFKSPPLSQIDQATIAGLSSNNKMDVPACMVFTFDKQHKVEQLAIYMDRYKMMDHLAPKEWTSVSLPEKRSAVAGTASVIATSAHGRPITITIKIDP